jgi:pyruvyltransferase
MVSINAYWHDDKGINNVGDTLTPEILHLLDIPFARAKREDTGKLLGVGSILNALRDNDIVWGSGLIRNGDRPEAKNVKYLALRGKLSEKILGIDCGVYGDPALLLPLFYQPKIEKKHTLGVIPHYIEEDEPFFQLLEHKINVRQDYKSFVDEILACERIISSSLHGIIIAEAYNVPAVWIKVTDKVIGNGFKFEDYLSGTGRKLPIASGEKLNYYHFPPIQNLWAIQKCLIQVIKDYVAKN